MKKRTYLDGPVGLYIYRSGTVECLYMAKEIAALVAPVAIVLS